MDEDSDLLDKLAAQIADGNSINWDEVRHLPSDDPRRRLFDHFRVVAEIAERHRSAVDDPAEQLTKEPDPDQAARIGHVRAALSGGEQGENLGQWGHLLLRRRIGAGAFGEVFHAHDLWLDHPVALKLLKPEIAKSDFSARILHEARRLARVRHPNVVSVHGADMHDGRIGFWMDLIEGETLAELLSRGRLSPGEASLIGQEICLALAAVHGANLVHRDVKAQNVMRASNGGRIVLMDFGAGEFIDRPSADGRMRGTPLYLAPELFERADASVATDIYAAGVLLYYLVTGGFPVTASSVQGLSEAHKQGIRRGLRDVRPDIPDSFASVVERAIDPNPARRFASSGEMYTALGGATAASGIAHPTTRQKVVRAVVGSAVVAAAITGIGFLAAIVFETVLRIDPAFALSPREYFGHGVRMLRPFIVVWGLAAAAVFVAVRLLPWRRLGATYVSSLLNRVDPTTLASLTVLLGAAGFVASTWLFLPVLNALMVLATNARPETLDLSILGAPGRNVHTVHSQVAVGLSFALFLAAWWWFPRLQQRSLDPARIRGLRLAAIVIAFLFVAEQTTTRPFLWIRREIASFKNQAAYVIGSSGQELLLYTPARGERRYFRVRVDSPELRRNVAAGALFMDSK